jgi:Na+/melibiose symporter-like transporter
MPPKVWASGEGAMVSAVPTADRRLDRSTRFFYGLGSVAFGVKDNGFSYMLMLFYNQVLGVPAKLVALALLTALVFDAVIDPVIGHLSDNLRSRWGRRHPFMYAAALPVALSYAALWNPPDLSVEGLFLYLTVLAVVIRAFIAFYEVPSSALAAEFTSGYDDRSVLLSYRFFFAWIGGLSIQALAFGVLLKPDATHAVGQLNPEGYARYGLIASIVMLIAILVSAAGTHRHIPTLRTPPEKQEKTLRQTLTDVRETLNNRSFLFLLASSIATALAGGLAASMNGYFNTFFWGFSAAQISLITLGVFVSAFVALPTAPLLSRRFGKKHTAMLLALLSLLIGIGPVLLRLAGLFPPNGDPAVFSILFATSIIGVTFGIIASTMGSSMIADVVEEAELKTGRRSEGLFFAASAFVSKAISGFGILAAALLIDAIGLQPGVAPADMPADVIQRMGAVYAPVIVILYLIGFALLSGYRISRESHAATLRALAADAEEAAHPFAVKDDHR